MEYTFFPGCLAQLKLPQVERSVRWVLARLGFRLREEPRFTCCPDPVVFRSASKEDWLKLAARNLSLDSEAPIVTLCPGCASSLSEARHLLTENGDMRRSVEQKLGRARTGLAIPEVSHFLRLLTDEGVLDLIAQALSSRLEGLKAACHYGCHLVRPSSAVRFDDPEKPTSLDSLVSLLGAEPVDYADKFMCCGRPSMDEDTAAGIAEHKLSRMKDAGCDLLVVACPFCFEQFDLGQITLARKAGRNFDIPVVYITQLIGIGMGQSPKEMGLDLHKVKVKVLH
jgi:heterodisulfide reductase subunit B